MKIIVKFFVYILLLSNLSAELKFESKEKEIELEFGIKKVKTSFQFTNVGNSEIEITKVKPSCGCTVAELDKTIYKAGEKGLIPVEIEVKPGKDHGRVSRLLNIVTKDNISNHTLKVNLVIPKKFEYPRYVMWKVSEPKEKKEFTLKVLNEMNVQVLNASSKKGLIKTTIQEKTKGESYLISLEPTEDFFKKNNTENISLETNYSLPDGSKLNLVISAFYPKPLSKWQKFKNRLRTHTKQSAMIGMGILLIITIPVFLFFRHRKKKKIKTE